MSRMRGKRTKSRQKKNINEKQKSKIYDIHKQQNLSNLQMTSRKITKMTSTRTKKQKSETRIAKKKTWY